LKITRGGRLTGDLTDDVARLTSSSEHDHYIADDVIEINMAHSLMLVKAGCLTPAEGRAIVAALKPLIGKIKSVPPDMEDVHMVIEEEVTKAVGAEIGGKMHTGKSRNDQVATALRMRLRSYLIAICRAVSELQAALNEKAAESAGTVMPGFTHLQHAQPVSAALHMLAYSDMLGRSLGRLMDCYRRVNLSPMGAAALAGTGFPIDRALVARYLGFDGLLENTMDAVASRDFALEAVSALSIMMVDMSRLAEELVIWSTLEFGYVDMPDDHSSTSSIMPQKKNPVTSEIMRAKVGDVFGELAAMTVIMKSLPLAYNLDMQEVNPHIWRACEASLLSLRVMADLVRKMRLRDSRLKDVVTRDFSVATELADVLVREGGLPFRKAHQAVGAIVKDLSESSKSLSEEPASRVAGMVFEKAGVRISEASVASAIDPVKNADVRATTGGPARKEIKRMLDARGASAKKTAAALAALSEPIDRGRRSMDEAL
jgi:argininosuccinate lyase